MTDIREAKFCSLASLLFLAKNSPFTRCMRNCSVIKNEYHNSWHKYFIYIYEAKLKYATNALLKRNGCGRRINSEHYTNKKIQRIA